MEGLLYPGMKSSLTQRMPVSLKADSLAVTLPEHLQRPQPLAPELVAAFQRPDPTSIPRYDFGSEQVPAAPVSLRISTGSVFVDCDGTRLMLIRQDEEGAHFVKWDGTQYSLLKTSRPHEVLDASRVRAVEYETIPRLIARSFEELPPGKSAWMDLSPGCLVERWEHRDEILRIKPGANISNVWVDLIRHHPDGKIEVLQGQPFVDLDLGGPNPPRVFAPNWLAIPSTGPGGSVAKGCGAESAEAQTQHPVLERFQKVLDRFAGALMFEGQVISDLISKGWENKTSGVRHNRLSRFEPLFEQTLEALRDLHGNIQQTRQVFDLAASHLYFASVPGAKDFVPAELLNVVSSLELNGAPSYELEWARSAAGHGHLARLNEGFQHLLKAASSGAGLSSRWVSDLEKRWDTALTALQGSLCRIDEIRRSIGEGSWGLLHSRAFTQFLTKEDVSPFLLNCLTSLVQSAPHGERAEGITKRGVVVSDYTPQYFQKLFDAGARCILYREMDRVTERHEPKAFLLYFEPNRLPAEAQSLARDLRDLCPEHQMSYVDLVLVHPQAQAGPAYNMLLNAHTVRLQGTGAHMDIAEIHYQNRPSLFRVLEAGGLPCIWRVRRSVQPDGHEIPWIAVTYPVSPDARRQRAAIMPAMTAAKTDLGKLITLHARYAANEAVLGTELVQAAVDRMTDRYRQAEAPVYMRVTCGAANMKAEDLAYGAAVFETGMEGYAGGVNYGSTEMLERKLDGTIGPFKQERNFSTIMMRVGQANPGIVVQGTVIETEDARNHSFPEVNQGRLVRVLGSEAIKDPATGQETPAAIITIRQRGIRFFETFRGQSNDPHRWDHEANIGIEVAKKLIPDRHVAPQRRNVLLVMGGGGTISREIEKWDALAKESPGWEIILVGGTGGAAQKFIDAPGWAEARTHVHVIAKEDNPRFAGLRLQELLRSFGAMQRQEQREEVLV